MFNGKEYVVEELKESSFDGIDLALFPPAVRFPNSSHRLPFKGCLVIDNSSCWREDPSVPLIVPEVNLNDYPINRLIANPNCSTIQAMLPLKALDEAFHLKRVVFQRIRLFPAADKGKRRSA